MNLNSLTAQNFEKVNLLEACNTVNNLIESFLDSSILEQNNDLHINGYKMVRADHPNKIKKGDVRANITEYLPVLNFINSYLSEYLTLEVTICNKKGYFITLCRCPSRTSNEFDTFISNLEKLFINITIFDPHFVILLGDLIA